MEGYVNEKIDIKKIFGEYVFNDKAMKKFMSKETYNSFKRVLKEEKEIPHNLAKTVAKAMCEWAISLGATHYTHWFQPLTNATAEKHDSFIDFNDKKEIITKLSGRALIKGESDASSLPSGGLRATFEARGYTAWDTTSPAFIKKDATGTTLCIPTAFYSYTGEALDKKAILLRSTDALNKETIKLLKLFGSKAKKVSSMLGAEQEYFLIDRHKYLHRKDIIYTGRTLFGAIMPKSQELFDHYYGSIRSKIGAFMNEVNVELWKLGVPAKTHHNEVAPAQHELAVIYEDANIACDHNQLVMETLRKVASEYDMVCLLHEKPFDKLNGSGKHNNWSIVTDEGENLLAASKNPDSTLQFLLILALVIKAVDENADILRSSASNIGNDRRLGGNEAPPTIISIFLGDELTKIFDNISNIKNSNSKNDTTIIKTGSVAIPDLYKDVSDRNRTSPFAYTGNKFEFRMVGSSDSCAMPIATINTIVAKSMREANEYFANNKTKNKSELKSLIINYIAKLYKEHKRVVFNGNGYSKEWIEEAKKRNLPIVPDMVNGIKVLKSKKAIDLFTNLGVMTESELLSRISVEYETYSNTICIEAKTMINMVKKQILPSCITYKKFLSDSINTIKNTNASTGVEEKLLSEVDSYTNDMSKALNKLESDLNTVENIKDIEEKAFKYRELVVKSMDDLRTYVDSLEMILDRELWPMPSYGDLVFEVSEI